MAHPWFDPVREDVEKELEKRQAMVSAALEDKCLDGN